MDFSYILDKFDQFIEEILYLIFSVCYLAVNVLTSTSFPVNLMPLTKQVAVE